MEDNDVDAIDAPIDRGGSPRPTAAPIDVREVGSQDGEGMQAKETSIDLLDSHSIYHKFVLMLSHN
jgi:hypothetical protein